jgi:hypothetical protein
MSADTSHTSEDFSDIDMDELDSYLTSPPVRPADPPRSRDARVARPRAARLLRGIALGPRTSTASFQIVSSDRVEADRGDASIPPSVTPRRTQAMLNDDDDDGARAAARARLAARAAHGEGGMAAQAAAEAAVAAVATGNASALSDLDPNVLSSLHARTPVSAPAVSEGAQKRKHIISPPMKVHRRKGNSGAPGVNVARAARDLCGDLGEPKESLMRRAVDVIGVVEANALAIEVGAIEGAGGQMTSDGTRRRTPGGVFWALLKARASKEDWDFIFAEEKEAARERCRRRRRAQSANGSPEGTPKERKDLNGLPRGALQGRARGARRERRRDGFGGEDALRRRRRASNARRRRRRARASLHGGAPLRGVRDRQGVHARGEGRDTRVVGRARRRAHARARDAPRALRARRRARRRREREAREKRRERRRGGFRGDHAGQRPRGGERHAGGILRRARARGGRRGGGGGACGAGPRARGEDRRRQRRGEEEAGARARRRRRR